MSFVALATCKNIPEPDVDEPLLVSALDCAGVPARVLAWDDEAVDWSAPRLVVIRSTWNYYLSPAAFLAWVNRQADRVVNDPRIVEWNHHKRYLRDLEARGLPVTPTVWFEQGHSYPFAELLAERGFTDIVVKPAISAGSYRTSRLKGPPFDTGALEDLVARGDTMAQPYVQSVEDYGERSVICIDGEITHAIRKSPRFKGGEEVVSDAIPVADDERRLATAALSLAQDVGSPMYARVDMVRDAAGQPMLSELELMEPSLFLRQSPAALERLASAIARRFQTRKTE